MNLLNVRAYAKINLGLDVLRKREDGYHEVRMIMQTVHIFDRLQLRKTKKKGISIKTNLFYLPVNEDNLVYKAAKLLIDEFELEEGIEIHLMKYIPVSAGMAGGSSDAAAVLYGVNQLFQLKLTLEELMQRGVRIGADVPYCLMRGTALSEGIGEILTPLPPAPPCFLLVAKPPINVSTKFVYENLRVDQLKSHPDIDSIIHAIRCGDIKKMAKHLENVLETVTIAEYPIIEEIKIFMKRHGAMNALMSGSGPTVFGLYETEQAARGAMEELKKSALAKQIYITTFYNRKKT